MARRIEINIDELVLNGFEPGDRYDIAKALEVELTRLFTVKDLGAGILESQDIEQLNAHTCYQGADKKKGYVGVLVAKSVYNGLNHDLQKS